MMSADMKPMTLNEIAIRDELQRRADHVIRLIQERDLARAELDQTKQRIAELGRTLDNCMQDAAELTAERDAFAAESDAVHRTVNEMCGTDTSTIEAVQHVINERDAARAERDAAKQYQCMAARR